MTTVEQSQQRKSAIAPNMSECKSSVSTIMKKIFSPFSKVQGKDGKKYEKVDLKQSQDEGNSNFSTEKTVNGKQIRSQQRMSYLGQKAEKQMGVARKSLDKRVSIVSQKRISNLKLQADQLKGKFSQEKINLGNQTSNNKLGISNEKINFGVSAATSSGTTVYMDCDDEKDLIQEIDELEEQVEEGDDGWLTKQKKQEFKDFFADEIDFMHKKCTEDPKINDWKLEFEEKKADHKLKIWLKCGKQGKYNIPQIRSEMFIPIEEFKSYMDFYNDIEKQKKIDANIDNLIQFNAFSDNFSENNYLMMYNCLKKVLIVEPRDMCFIRNWRQINETTWVEAQKNIEHPDYPEFAKATRVDIYHCGTVGEAVTIEGKKYQKISTFIESNPKLTAPWFALKSGSVITYKQNRLKYYDELKKSQTK